MDAKIARGEGGPLAVSVADNGSGIDPQVAAGVGLVSLRERAAELGGRCTVTAAPGGGTLVHAELPLSTVPGRPGVRAESVDAGGGRHAG